MGEIYAGHAAWRNWFELCAVKKCKSDEQRALVRQIGSALTQALQRYGLTPKDFAGEDLSDLFDIHFILQGAKTSPKPLKSYYLARVNPKDDEALKKLVCGTFFSQKRGLVRDLARKVIPLVKGWMPHKVDGKIVWEAPLELKFDDDGCEIPLPEQVSLPAVIREDARVWRRHVAAVFKAIGGTNATDAPLLVYAIANGIRPYNEVVWRILGVKSVMANRRFHQALEAMASYMKKSKLSFEDKDFVSALIASAEKTLGATLIAELKGSR